jgi:hypothetical protein
VKGEIGVETKGAMGSAHFSAAKVVFVRKTNLPESEKMPVWSKTRRKKGWLLVVGSWFLAFGFEKNLSALQTNNR